MEHGANVVVVQPPAEVPAEPIPAEVTIEAPPAPAPAPDPEEIRRAAAEALQQEREELREELLSAEAIARMRSDTQSIRAQVEDLRNRLEAMQQATVGEISSLNSNLQAILQALTEEEPGGDPAAPPQNGESLELAPAAPRGIWEALR